MMKLKKELIEQIQDTIATAKERAVYGEFHSKSTFHNANALRSQFSGNLNK